MKEITIDLHNYAEDEPVVRRTAVRGVVRRGETFLMIYSRKFGDCKFPGGGLENGETHADTLLREMREETGYDVLPETVQEYAVVHERRRGVFNDVMFMDSYYYFCAVGDEIHPQELQGYELEEDYEICWLKLDEAIKRNRRANQPERTPWIQREIAVMEMLAEGE